MKVEISGCHAAIGEGHSYWWHLAAVKVPRRVERMVDVVVVTQAVADGIQASAFDRRDSSWMIVVGKNNPVVGLS